MIVQNNIIEMNTGTYTVHTKQLNPWGTFGRSTKKFKSGTKYIVTRPW